MAQEYCAAPDCVELAKRGDYCWTHYAWVRADKPLTAPKNTRKNGMDPLERLLEACHTVSNYDDSERSDPGFKRAIDNLCASAENYTKKLWRDRARRALEKARKEGRLGRPRGTFKKGRVSRWTRRRRETFREVLDVALIGGDST